MVEDFLKGDTMTEEQKKEKEEKSSSPVPWQKFLEEYPPGKMAVVSGLFIEQRFQQFPPQFKRPELKLFCSSNACQRRQYFEEIGDFSEVKLDDDLHLRCIFLSYRCKNCESTLKNFAVAYCYRSNASPSLAYKFGELPAFSVSVSPRLIELIRPNEELFKAGCDSENQGMGIGAFAYYRRVVNNQKDRIIDKIIEVIEETEEPNIAGELKTKLEKAKKVWFTQGVKEIQSGLPTSLFVSFKRSNENNPLLILHQAASEGLHIKSDEECLAAARSMREMMLFLAERLQEIVKDHSRWRDAAKSLMKFKHTKTKKSESNQSEGKAKQKE